MIRQLMSSLVAMLLVLHVIGQDSLVTSDVSMKSLRQISSRTNHLNKQLSNKTDNALKDLKQLESRIQKKLAILDPEKAKLLAGQTTGIYKELEEKLKGPQTIRDYLPSLDTLTTSLKFLEKYSGSLTGIKDANEKLTSALKNAKELNSKFQEAETIRQFIRERKQYLSEQLNKMQFARELKSLSKQSYYYAQQINEYKALLKDRRKAEKKALELLSKTTLFKDFMRKNSALASLFGIPGSQSGTGQTFDLSGLQTRTQVNNLIGQQIAAGGPGAREQFSQNLQEAQGQLNQLKDKIWKAGGGSSNDEMPEGFKPNRQKTKSFWKKWELSINTQNERANNFFPVTTDAGLMAGFKPHDKFVIGVGIGGKIGWGRDIKHIAISYQGLSFKSFTEINLKGSFHFLAGYELHYRDEIKDIDQLKDYSAWSQSALAGISKIVSTRSKFFKKTRFQVLFDFLHSQQINKPPVVFRIGYGL